MSLRRPRRGTPRGATRPRGAGRGSRHARRPGPALGQRLRGQLPRLSRAAAVLLVIGSVGGLLWLVEGPWLRVARVDWSGERYTSLLQLERLMNETRGLPLLAVDTGDLAARIAALPSVAEVRVEAVLPDMVSAVLVEKPAAFVWQTSAVRLIGAADGTLIGQVALRADMPAELATLPQVADARRASRDIIVGDRIEPEILATALRLAQVAPPAIGSASGALQVAVDDEYGFLLVAADQGWRAAFGYYDLDTTDDPDALTARVEQQVAAVRTLFSVQAEEGVGWIDARNPGRVYWRP